PPSVEEASHDQLDHQVTISRQQQVNAVMIPSLWVFLTSLFQPRVFFTSVLYSSQFPIRLQVQYHNHNETDASLIERPLNSGFACRCARVAGCRGMLVKAPRSLSYSIKKASSIVETRVPLMTGNVCVHSYMFHITSTCSSWSSGNEDNLCLYAQWSSLESLIVTVSNTDFTSK
ncbi:hypothetical protein L914_04605, partial [Phytophthora nicotianae]